MPSSDYQRYISNEQQKRRTKRILLEILVSALLITPAIVLSIYMKEFIERKILEKVKLEPDSDGFQSWLKPPITTTRNYYLFNVTNPMEIVLNPSSATIHLKDTPPYAYNVITNKKNVQWLNNNTEISYEVERLFTRHPDQFNLSSIKDTGAFVDMLRATFRTQFGVKPTDAFYDIAGYNPFYQRYAVQELEGFTSDLFVSMKDKMFGPNIDKSGYVYRQNGSRLYNISIETDPTKKGQVLTFSSELVPFEILSPSNYSFPIYDGLTFPPMLFDKPILNIFNSDFCRPILIKFNKVKSMYGGIPMHEYKVKLIDVDNCTNPNDTDTCNEVDKLDVSKCISTTLPENTIFLSKAHFYGSNNETIQEMNIQGFKPINDKHDSVVYFEPYSGVPFEASYRMQLNIQATIDPMKEIEDGTRMEPTKRKGVKRLLPIFWIDQKINMSKDIIKQFERLYFILHYGQYILMTLAISLSIIFIILMEFFSKRAANNDRYLRGAYIQSEY